MVSVSMVRLTPPVNVYATTAVPLRARGLGRFSVTPHATTPWADQVVEDEHVPRFAVSVWVTAVSYATRRTLFIRIPSGSQRMLPI